MVADFGAGDGVHVGSSVKNTRLSHVTAHNATGRGIRNEGDNTVINGYVSVSVTTPISASAGALPTQMIIGNDGGANWLETGLNESADRVLVQAKGSETNIDIKFLPKGAGSLRFGTWTTNADVAVNGYVTIKDVGGTLRKLATIA